MLTDDETAQGQHRGTAIAPQRPAALDEALEQGPEAIDPLPRARRPSARRLRRAALALTPT